MFCLGSISCITVLENGLAAWSAGAEVLGDGLCRCNRESRHRGVCNARAAAPGFTPAQEEAVSFDNLPKEELGSVKEEPSEGHNDSEQGTCPS